MPENYKGRYLNTIPLAHRGQGEYYMDFDFLADAFEIYGILSEETCRIVRTRWLYLLTEPLMERWFRRAYSDYHGVTRSHLFGFGVKVRF